MVYPIDIIQAAETLWAFHGVYDPLSPCDAIVGLGSYDLRVAERCAGLLHEGLSDRIVFTGSSGNWTHGLYDGSEAAAFRDHAVAAGVPTTAILIEETASNIGDNITQVSRLIPDTRSVVIVTKPQTQLRCRATVDKIWPGVRSLVTAPLTSLKDQPTKIHDKHALYCEMVGDVQRMLTYPSLGFQTRVDVPEKVLEAFEILKDAGFTDHLPKPVRDA